MRRPRVKIQGRPAIYLVSNKCCGHIDAQPLEAPEAREKFLQILAFYAKHYFCQVSCCRIGPRDFIFRVRVEAFRRLKLPQLKKIAASLYSGKYKPHKHWDKEEWRHFNRRLFDLSAFMQNVEMLPAMWHNARFDCEGHFWAGRFVSEIISVGLPPWRIHLQASAATKSTPATAADHAASRLGSSFDIRHRTGGG